MENFHFFRRYRAERELDEEIELHPLAYADAGRLVTICRSTVLPQDTSQTKIGGAILERVENSDIAVLPVWLKVLR